MYLNQTPTKVYLEDVDNKTLSKIKDYLSYTNTANQQKYLRFKKNRWFMSKHGEDAYNEELFRLQKSVYQCLLKTDSKGIFTYSGLAADLAKNFNITLLNRIQYPEAKLLPWLNKPEFELRYYQQESVEKLLAIKHGNIEMATGLGKTAVIQRLIKELGLQTIVICPSTNIAEQIFTLIEHSFGSKYVGKMYDGAKEYKKLITIALPQTLSKLEPKSKEYQKLSKSNVLISDESHSDAAESFKKVCLELCKDIPYRFFLSATQMRNDGQDLLLKGIIGETVYRMTLKEGVDQGFLAKPIFKMVNVPIDTECYKTDPNDITRHCLYYNNNVIKTAALLANNFVKYNADQVLILIDEVEQFTRLLPYLEYEVGFAHGPLSENKSKVPEKFHESNPTSLVQRFNSKELPILVGTSCISTGTDIKTVKTLIYLMGGKSEIKVKQAIGRGTRLVPGKTQCNIIDFNVYNNYVTNSHAEQRRAIYNSLYGPVEDISF